MYSIAEVNKNPGGRLGIAPLIATGGMKIGTSILKSVFGSGKNNDFGLPNDVWEQHLKNPAFFRFTWTALKSFKNQPETAAELPQGWTTADLYFNQFDAKDPNIIENIRKKQPGKNGITKDGRYEYFNAQGQQLWSDNKITQPEFIAAVNEAYGVQQSIFSPVLPNVPTVASTASFLTSGTTPYLLGAAAIMLIMMKGSK